MIQMHKENHNHTGSCKFPKHGKIMYLHNKHFDLSDGATHIKYDNHILHPITLLRLHKINQNDTAFTYY